MVKKKIKMAIELLQKRKEKRMACFLRKYSQAMLGFCHSL
jgi:hypothetical protein